MAVYLTLGKLFFQTAPLFSETFTRQNCTLLPTPRHSGFRLPPPFLPPVGTDKRPSKSGVGGLAFSSCTADTQCSENRFFAPSTEKDKMFPGCTRQQSTNASGKHILPLPCLRQDTSILRHVKHHALRQGGWAGSSRNRNARTYYDVTF
jgi:hypothetical protein